MIGIAGTVLINGGRGRATLQCAQSIHRIDAQLGRLLDINSAWRDPLEQEKLYTAYRNYVNGNGPWAPIALKPEDSVHCDGEAIDSDDQSAEMVKLLGDNGWFRTVYRWVNGVYTLVEPWHYEYDYKRDKFFGGIPAGSEIIDMPLDSNDKAWLNGLGASIIAQINAADAPIRSDINTVHGAVGTQADRTINAIRTSINAQPDKVWNELLPAQKPDGTPLTSNGKPVQYTAEGFVASTNAQIGELAKTLAAINTRLTNIEAKLPK